MSQNYARLLQNQDQVEHFLTVVLDHDFSALKTIYYDIVDGEKGLVNLNVNAQTLSNTEYRDRNFKDDKMRWPLRKTIIEELFSLERPDDDDTIILGNGGALPKSAVKAEKQAYILIGLPASGKSGIANVISEDRNAIINDSDYAKRKLPEYPNYKWGATIVHEESSQIVTGFKNNPENIKSLYQEAIAKGYNMVIPKIGQDPNSIIALAQSLSGIGYDVHLTLVLLKKERRLYGRFTVFTAQSVMYHLG